MSEARLVNCLEDEVVLRQDDPSRVLYKVLSGSVGLYLNYGQADEYLVGVVSAPRCFGEMTILAGQPAPYTVVALKETALLRVPEDNFERFIRDNHQNAIMIMKTMARNLAMVNMNMGLLIDELTELSRGEQVDEAALKRLAAQYSGEESGPVMDQEEEPEPVKPPEPPDAGIFPVGHKRYPGITHPEYREGVYQKRYSCPHCGSSFMGWHIFSSKLVVSQEASWMTRYDGRRAYQNFEPCWYEVVTCPECCFSAISNCFLESRMLMKDRYENRLREAVKQLKPNPAAERDLNFVFTQHYLALICAQGLLFTQRRQSTAKLWKNLCWLYEDAGDHDMERLAAEAAAQALLDARDPQERDTVQQQKTLLDVAAMFQKAANRQQAWEYALKARDRNPDSLYGGMAQRLLDTLREERRGADPKSS